MTEFLRQQKQFFLFGTAAGYVLGKKRRGAAMPASVSRRGCFPRQRNSDFNENRFGRF